MKRLMPLAALLLAPPVSAEDAPVTPASIVASAPQADWLAIDPADLLVMDLAPDAEGQQRQVVIQLMPPPFSQGWVENIRTLAAAHWWDGTSVYRVQDNYVVQWGDVTERKVLPDGLRAVPESEYLVQDENRLPRPTVARVRDAYTYSVGFAGGFPIAIQAPIMHVNGGSWWPVHCYGMVGVARDLATTGTGSDLYVVIGQAPRQLDRNIALVGRVISGIENLSALPRGHGELGFYGDDETDKRVPILSVRLGSELPEDERPQFEYLSTESDSFAAYIHARANRQDDFYKIPAGRVDICNAPVPVRPFEYNP